MLKAKVIVTGNGPFTNDECLVYSFGDCVGAIIRKRDDQGRICQYGAFRLGACLITTRKLSEAVNKIIECYENAPCPSPTPTPPPPSGQPYPKSRAIKSRAHI